MTYPFAPAVAVALTACANADAESDPSDNGLLKSTTPKDLESLCAKLSDQQSAGVGWIGFKQPAPWPDNYPPFDGHRLRMQAYLEHHAALLVREAESLGFVLSITQRHVDPVPATGRTINEITVTPKRTQAS